MATINPSELDLLEESVIKINRTAKVTSRGKRFRFSALVAVGDGKGHIGIGLGKANEVIVCIQKGKEIAKRNMFKIPLVNGTIPHKIIGKHGASSNVKICCSWYWYHCWWSCKSCHGASWYS